MFGVVICSAALATGCASALVMDTARAVPAGKTRVTLAGAAGAQVEQMLTLDSPTHPEWPDWRPREPTVDFPETAFQFEWMFRWSRGLGAGFQLDAQFSLPVPTGISAGLGVKWELPLPDDSPLAVALAGRGSAMGGGFESNGFGSSTAVVTADPGVIFSAHLPGDHALYASPRIRWDYVHHSSWVEEAEASTDADSRSYAVALGWKIPVTRRMANDDFYGIAATERGELFIELNLIHTPQPTGEDGWRGMIGFGGTLGAE